MALFEMVMPQMGESVMEGTIIKWLKKVGDQVKQDESVLEVATDKVDTEIPSTFSGYIQEFLVNEGDVVQIGRPIALINSEKPGTASAEVESKEAPSAVAPVQEKVAQPQEKVEQPQEVLPPVAEVVTEEIKKTEAHIAQAATVPSVAHSGFGRFYSPLVLNIAKEENIPFAELETIVGTGQEGRVTKSDILEYVKSRPAASIPVELSKAKEAPAEDEKLWTAVRIKEESQDATAAVKPAASVSGQTDIIQMDRMRKMISERMLDSQRISAHVTSFVEADITNLIHWKNKMKHEFKNKENDTLTLTPLFIEAIARAIKDYPMINASVEGDKILLKKYVNIGMAVALPSGNLIVPVIKNVDQLNIIGITKKVNELARKARENKLTADDLSDGTYTMSNVGQFGNVMGTPIIVQPQIAIMAFGTAVKKPAVIETAHGDAIGIRQMMFLSHSYDHRVVDGALGGMFVRRVADYLENFDVNRKIW
ncbi:MAG TPA: dihydrolipoamide acetyltransferase family protein [Cytophagales bacterium]|nr:dihydrolipoamide acetyltransferase family protein [Cytophagales bacterium]